MWMQILQAGGLEVIGDAFPSHWEESIKQANTRGFFESKLRKGIFYLTNPDPKTGAFFPPAQTRRHAVKVFIPGLVRSDLAFLDRVLVSMRHWREYGPSLDRLYAMEDAYLGAKQAEEPEDPRWRTQRTRLPSAIEWWFDNYELVRDASTRRYPVHMVTYDHLLRDPDQVLGTVLPWVGAANREAARAAIAPSARTQTERIGGDDGVDSASAAVFDELFGLCDSGKPLPAAFLHEMNATQERLVAQYRPEAANERDDPRQEE